ncbi:hypothetical protein Sru01_45190 [Sphaerisporangium rufum]|uniref:Barstar (barnase inhibitor) domain-containing protein n=1 Tax=Sphaerisporangium rufum TaxID=1381558 RepID=A0A919R939_9ACTN|nr:barstar family protein [Sphaerisporangium rufum]GII79537.1 hypothetical protein Sru01_45190 [Sphaerisporangium rufum]
MTTAARPSPSWLTVSTGPVPVVLDGRACRTRAAFFTEAARALRLPGYFGHNWDALTDALRDVAAGQGVHLVVAHAEELLAAEPADRFAMLLDVLGGAGLPVTLRTDSAHEPALRARVTAALG